MKKTKKQKEVLKVPDYQKNEVINSGKIKELERKHQEEINELKGILSSMGEGLIVVSKNFKVVLFNQAAGILLRIAPSEAIGKNMTEVLSLFKGNKKLAEKDSPINKAIEQSGIIIVRLEDNLYARDRAGRLFPVALTVTASLLEEDNIGAVVILRDITREKEIDKAKSEFVSIASHQLRTPLSTINWYTEMLLEGDVGEINKNQKEYLEEIYGGAQRMTALVNALLNVSRIELGTLIIEPEPTDFIKFTNNMLNEFLPQIRAKKIKIEKDYPRGLPKINVDPKIMRIVFQNLLSNAIKYTPKEGWVSLEIKKQKPNLLIKIADNGYGIPKHQQVKIFTKLFRADNVMKKETEGTGLGLYIIKSVLEQAGGQIWFSSLEDIPGNKGLKRNSGTTFYVAIPLAGMKKKEGRRKPTTSHSL